jgi:hypothetical protein
MKKTLLTIAIINFLAASVFAQGEINFKNGTATPFTFTTDEQTYPVLTLNSTTTPHSADADGFGPVTVEIFSAPVGTSLAGDESDPIPALTGPGSPWSLSTTQLNSTAYLGSGVWTPTTIVLNNAPIDQDVELEVIAFTGTLANPTAFDFSGNFENDGAFGWVQPTGGGLDPPASMVTGPDGFDGLVMDYDIPEPSTIALDGLGAAVLWLFRRRK